MQKRQQQSSARLLLPLLMMIGVIRLPAQQTIGRTTATEVKVSGAVDIAHGETLLGNGSDITAGNQAVKIALQRGGSLQLCSTSSVYLARDGSIDDKASSALMMALEHGAIEANYTVGKYSDVLMTPDLRILVSGPGQASLSVRVNSKGDTCVDNRGADAPYVTVSSQFEGGAYRVMPNQRVSFEHGSLLEVVDHEPEPCGCPAAPAPSLAQGTNPAATGRPVGGPSSTPADTAFPIAQSEGLAPAPPHSTAPVVPAGQVHAEVSVPLVYNAEAPAESSSAPARAVVPAPVAAVPAPAPAPATPVPVAKAPAPVPDPPEATAPPPANPIISRPPGGGNIFHSIGHFFSKIFGK